MSSPKAPSVSSSGVLLVVEVRVVEVDPVGAQTSERILGGAADGCGRETCEPGHLADLRRDHDVVAVAARGHPAADDRLRTRRRGCRDPGRVRVGGVDEVAAGGRVGVEHGERLRLVDRPAEDVAAEAEREDRELRRAVPIVAYQPAADLAARRSTARRRRRAPRPAAAPCAAARRRSTAAATANIAPTTKAAW